MDNEILESIKHIKNISKKKVTADKIFTNIKKKDSSISFDELLEILDTMVKDGILHENGMDKSKTYMKTQTVFLFLIRKMLTTHLTKTQK